MRRLSWVVAALAVAGCGSGSSNGDGGTGQDAGPPLPSDCRQTPCPSGYYCDLSNGKCNAGCAADSQCPQPGACDLASHQCTCQTGYNLCGGQCAADSPQQCGPSCAACTPPANATATCSAGSCGFTCATGFSDCGGVCAACPTSGVVTTSCSGTSCVAASCSGGYSLCGGACSQCPSGANVLATGCLGSVCVATSCSSGYHPCASGCCPWQVEVIDNRSYPQTVDLKVDGQGNPFVAYGLNPSGLAVFASKVNGAWQPQTVDTSSSSTQLVEVSLALGAGGTPQLAYSFNIPPPIGGSSSGSVNYAALSGGSWQPQQIDFGTYGRDEPSLALDAQGNPWVSYDNGISGGIALASPSGGFWQSQPASASGLGSSLQIINGAHAMVFETYGADGGVVFSEDSTGSWSLTPIAPGGAGGHLVADGSGHAHVLFQDASNRLRYASNASGSWQTQTVDPTATVNYALNLALDAAGNPHACYVASSNWLEYASWTGSQWSTQVVVPDGGVALGSCAVAVDAVGQPHIAFIDQTDHTVEYAH